MRDPLARVMENLLVCNPTCDLSANPEPPNPGRSFLGSPCSRRGSFTLGHGTHLSIVKGY